MKHPATKSRSDVTSVTTKHPASKSRSDVMSVRKLAKMIRFSVSQMHAIGTYDIELWRKNNLHMKPDTYTQIHIQSVLVVKYRQAMILPYWKEELNKYITGVVQGCGHKMLEINSVPDHLHLFFGMRPTQSISDLMKIVKAESSGWINDRGFAESRFEWQAGYGAFSYCKSEVQTVINYIKNQERHHARESFKDEYVRLLREFEVDYDSNHLFLDPI
jgi:putative transposase